MTEGLPGAGELVEGPLDLGSGERDQPGAAGIVLPFAYPPLRRGIRESPLLKAGASALLGAPNSATDR